mgnify:CR=1 FL=1
MVVRPYSNQYYKDPTGTEEEELGRLRFKVRFDYVSRNKAARKLFSARSQEQVAEEIRQHKVSMIRNVPIQGIFIEDIDMSQEVYAVIDEINGKELIYAPVVITFSADSFEDVIRFTMKEEFRTIEMLEPEELTFSRIELERMILRINDTLTNYRQYLQRKIDNWK